MLVDAQKLPEIQTLDMGIHPGMEMHAGQRRGPHQARGLSLC